MNVLFLDNTPIIKIRNKYYVIARLKYKSEIVTIPDLKEIISYDHQDKVKLFRELVEICKLDDFLKPVIWKTKAQLDDFWYSERK